MKKLSVILAVAAFAFGFFLRQTSDNDSVSRIWSAVNDPEATRQMAAYNSQGAASDVGAQSNVDLRPMETFYSVRQIVRDHFVERIKDDDWKNLTYSSLRTMLDSLKDPYTRFYEPEQTRTIEAARQGKFYGIGAVFAVTKEKMDDMTNEKLAVMTVLPGSPAEKAGLRTGDVITEVDGKAVLPYDPFQKAAKILKSARDNTADREKLQKELDAEDKRIKNGISFQRTIDMLSTDAKKDYALTVSRTGVASALKMKLTGAETVVDPISHSLAGKDVGYIRIRLITEPVVREFALAVSDMEKSSLKGLVIDLRDATGGSPDVAAQVASWFSPDKVLSNLARTNDKKQILRIPKFEAPEGVTAKPWNGKVVVLTDEGTSGVAEVLAAALKENGVGKTVGQTTYGQALQQTVFEMRDGSAVGITTGKYLTPTGKDFNLKGLAADVRIANTSKDGTDQQLARAVELARVQ